MPFARVGAMPQPTSSKQRNDQRKVGSIASARQKGITMEVSKVLASAISVVSFDGRFSRAVCGSWIRYIKIYDAQYIKAHEIFASLK
jgi:hypothetical protein